MSKSAEKTQTSNNPVSPQSWSRPWAHMRHTRDARAHKLTRTHTCATGLHAFRLLGRFPLLARACAGPRLSLQSARQTHALCTRSQSSVYKAKSQRSAARFPVAEAWHALASLEMRPMKSSSEKAQFTLGFKPDVSASRSKWSNRCSLGRTKYLAKPCSHAWLVKVWYPKRLVYRAFLKAVRSDAVRSCPALVRSNHVCAKPHSVTARTLACSVGCGRLAHNPSNHSETIAQFQALALRMGQLVRQAMLREFVVKAGCEQQ